MVLRRKHQAIQPPLHFTPAAIHERVLTECNDLFVRFNAARQNNPYRGPTPWDGRGEEDVRSTISSAVSAGVEIRRQVDELQTRMEEQNARMTEQNTTMTD